MIRLVYLATVAAVCMQPPAFPQPVDFAFEADIASMESCVLETAHVGEEDSCTGLIASGCLEDGNTLRSCLVHETRVWAAIAEDMKETLGDKTDFTTNCGDDDGSSRHARCLTETMARFASELLLEVEG